MSNDNACVKCGSTGARPDVRSCTHCAEDTCIGCGQDGYYGRRCGTCAVADAAVGDSGMIIRRFGPRAGQPV